MEVNERDVRRRKCPVEMTTSAEGMVKLVELFTHGLCEALALELHQRTGFPTYSIYDPSEEVYSWGVNYWHSLVRVGEDCFLSARGLHTERETIAFWAAAWKDPSLVERAVLIPREIVLSGTGDCEIDRCMTEMCGDPCTIQPHTVQFAAMLLKAYGIAAR